MTTLYSLLFCNELPSETWMFGAHKTCLKVLQGSRVLASRKLVVVVLVYVFVVLLLLLPQVWFFLFFFFISLFFLFHFDSFFISSVFDSYYLILEFVFLNFSALIYLGTKRLLYNVLVYSSSNKLRISTLAVGRI